MCEVFPCLLHGFANTRADFDLRLQKLGFYLFLEQLLALAEHRWRGLFDQIARLAIDQQVFLLDTNGETRFLDHRLESCTQSIVRETSVHSNLAAIAL